MPLNDQDKAWIHQEITRGRGWRGFLKDWIGAATAVAIILGALSKWSDYVEFRTHTQDRLDSIEQKDLPGIEKRLDTVEGDLKGLLSQNSLAVAGKYAKEGKMELAITATRHAAEVVASAAANKLPTPAGYFADTMEIVNGIARASTSSELATTLQEVRLSLARYRSVLNSPPPIPTQTAPLPAETGSGLALVTAAYPNTTTINLSPPKPVTIFGDGAAIDCSKMRPGQQIIGVATRSLDQNPVLIKGLIFIGATQTLDYITWSNVTFVSTHVRYQGGPVRLENVRFVNCTFDFPRQGAGTKLAEYAALEPKQKLEIRPPQSG